MRCLRFLICVVALTSTALFSSAADRILFTRLTPLQATLLILNADGSGEKALTKPGSLDYNPAWSPRGDWILFTSERGGSADLYRIHPDGTALDRLTDDPASDDQGAFSPDGKQVVFVTTCAVKPGLLPSIRAPNLRSEPSSAHQRTPTDARMASL